MEYGDYQTILQFFIFSKIIQKLIQNEKCKFQYLKIKEFKGSNYLFKIFVKEIILKYYQLITNVNKRSKVFYTII